MPLKSSRTEDEYFAKEEAIKLRKLAVKSQTDMASEEKKRLKQLHWMHCPKCGLSMSTITINKVEVDKCFFCGGLYFDEGELEKVSGKESFFFKEMTKVFTEE